MGAVRQTLNDPAIPAQAGIHVGFCLKSKIKMDDQTQGLLKSASSLRWDDGGFCYPPA